MTAREHPPKSPAPTPAILATIVGLIARSGHNDISAAWLYQATAAAGVPIGDAHAACVELEKLRLLRPHKDPELQGRLWTLPTKLRDHQLPDRISAALWVERAIDYVNSDPKVDIKVRSNG